MRIISDCPLLSGNIELVVLSWLLAEKGYAPDTYPHLAGRSGT